jgi:tetratricopeptide (TPR) repeat protein
MKRSTLYLSVYLCLFCVLTPLFFAPLFAQKLPTPRTWRTFVEPALARMMIGDTTGAVEAMNAVVIGSGDSASAYTQRGLMFSGIERFDEAMRDFATAIGKDSANPEHLMARGLAFMDKKQYVEAVKDFSACTVLNENFLPAYFYRAEAATRLGDNDGALFDYADVLRLDSTHLEALMKSAFLSIKQKKNREARQFLTRAIRTDATFAEAYMVRAGLLIDDGKSDDACRDLAEAVKYGYKPALELMRTQCAKYVTKRGLDTLQSYVMGEVTIESERDQYVRAAQEMKFVAKKAQQIAGNIANRIGMRQAAPQTAGLGTGTVYMSSERASIAGAGGLPNTTLTAIETKRASQISIDDLVAVTRQRVLTAQNTKATERYNVLLRKRAQLAAMLQMESKENAGEMRALVWDIASLIQEITDILNEKAESK